MEEFVSLHIVQVAAIGFAGFGIGLAVAYIVMASAYKRWIKEGKIVEHFKR